MLLGAVLIDAAHAALEDRKEAFDRVGVDVAAHIFADAGDDGAMVGETALAMPRIERVLVGHEVGFAGDVRLHDRLMVRGASAGRRRSTRLAAVAVDQATAPSSCGASRRDRATPPCGCRCRFRRPRPRRRRRPTGRVAVAHGFADAVRHEPSGLEGDAQGAVKLVGADALLAAGDQIHRLQPDMHRDVRLSKMVPIRTVNGLRHW